MPYCSLPKFRTSIGVETKPSRIGKSHAITLNSEFAARPRRLPVGSAATLYRLLIRSNGHRTCFTLVEICNDKFPAAFCELGPELFVVLEIHYRRCKSFGIAGLDQQPGLHVLYS